jgi:hypothetical protein
MFMDKDQHSMTRTDGVGTNWLNKDKTSSGPAQRTASTVWPFMDKDQQSRTRTDVVDTNWSNQDKTSSGPAQRTASSVWPFGQKPAIHDMEDCFLVLAFFGIKTSNPWHELVQIGQTKSKTKLVSVLRRGLIPLSGHFGQRPAIQAW